MLYELREAVLDYSSILSEAKYKTINGKGIPVMSTRVARGRLARVVEVSDHSNVKILSSNAKSIALKITNSTWTSKSR